MEIKGDEITFKIGNPTDFTADEISFFVALLEKQDKVHDPSAAKVRRCKLLGMAFSAGKSIGIGAIKKKTASDFWPAKANLPEMANDFDWEVGYFFTEPGSEGKRISSTILSRLLVLYGNGSLMATTEIREGNRMIDSLEHRQFKQVGVTWKSTKSKNDLRLFIREKQNG